MLFVFVLSHPDFASGKNNDRWFAPQKTPFSNFLVASRGHRDHFVSKYILSIFVVNAAVAICLMPTADERNRRVWQDR